MAAQLGEKIMRVLYETQRMILAQGKDTDALLAILARSAAEISGVPGFGLIFYDSSQKTSRIRFNTDLPTQELAGLMKNFTTIRVANQPMAVQLIDNVHVPGKTFQVPIGDLKEPFGAMFLSAPDGEIQLEGIEEFRTIAADAITKFMEVELVRLQMAELATLLEVGKAISSTLDLNELLNKIMRMATQVMRCETSTVYLVDRHTNELYFHIIQGDAKIGSKLQEIRLPMGTGLAGWCAKENKPVIVPDTEKDPRFFRGADKKSGFVTRSMICVPMKLKDEVVGVLQVLNRTGDIPFNNHDVEILEAVANQAVSALDNARLYENIQKVYLATVEVLATAIDAKDPYTHGHSRRVTQYSVAIAEELGFDKKSMDDVRYAGLLHDVGKIGIEDRIIRKPERLTDDEYAEIKKHPKIGAEILKPVDFLADKIPGVLHHHEYFDGRGYPAHLVGEDIPLIGRIICVADAFDAMTSNRPYRKGLSVSVAVNELKKFSGKQFDPVCVDAFLKCCDKHSFDWFDKVADSEELMLKPLTEKAHQLKEIRQGEEKRESQPYPPAHMEKAKDTQPYPPLIPEGKEMTDPAATVSRSKPSSQPFPPIGMPASPSTGDNQKKD